MGTSKHFTLRHLRTNLAVWTLIALLASTHLGCDKPPAPPIPEMTPKQAMRLEEIMVEAPGQEPSTQDIWNWLIDDVVEGQSSSISMPEKVTNTMLEQLAKASKAVELLLDAGVVDDQGVALIVQYCPELEHFRARFSPITDQGGQELAKLSKLRLINLPHGKVAGPSIQAWKQLTQLNHLRLGGKQIDDATLAEIVKLPELQSLHLIGPSLTDEGLQQLISAKKLSSFYIDDCPFSEAAWAKLKKARPDLHVHVDQVHPDR